MKCFIKIEFSFLKINILFSLKIVNNVDNGPPLPTSTLQKEVSKSNFFRDIQMKIYSFISLSNVLLKLSLVF